MCANYTPSRRDLLATNFGVAPPAAPYADEAYPGSPAPFVRAADRGRVCELGLFGLVPPWAEAKLVKSTYNARSETAAVKPSFRDAWRRGQFCVIPADSVFEPCYESGRAVRWEIAAASALPLGIAGLWSSKTDADGAVLLSFTMLTINADDHPLMRRMHRPEDEKRMVAMLRPEQYDRWLTCAPQDAPGMLKQMPAEALLARPAPRTVARPPQAGLF